MQEQDILALAYQAIDGINLQLPIGNRIEKAPGTVLLGAGSALDFLTLGNFVVTFEEALETRHGVRHVPLDDRYLGGPDGPLQHVGSLDILADLGCGAPFTTEVGLVDSSAAGLLRPARLDNSVPPTAAAAEAGRWTRLATD